jgi:hypothetical protein
MCQLPIKRNIEPKTVDCVFLGHVFYSIRYNFFIIKSEVEECHLSIAEVEECEYPKTHPVFMKPRSQDFPRGELWTIKMHWNIG